MSPAISGRSHEDRVRIGPISLLTLITVICLAVLAVLAISTAHASLVMAQRQADSVSDMYLNETAAQQFVANVDDALAHGGADNVQRVLFSAARDAEDAAGGQVSANASMEGDVVSADFTCVNGRVLSIEVTIRENSTYRIDKWKVTAVQNEEQPPGSFLIVD